MKRLLRAGLIAVALIVSEVARAGVPETLARASAWDVSYNEDSCSLVVQFGEGAKNVTAEFKRYDLGDTFDFALYGQRFRDTSTANGATLDFGLGPPMRRDAIVGAKGEMPMVIFNSIRLDGWAPHRPPEDGPKITPDQERAVTRVTVSLPSGRAFRLDFGSLGKPFEALRTCQADLLRHWGFDPQVQATLRRRVQPRGNAGNWLDSSDYPQTALFKQMNGLVQFRLDVDALGKVSACHILFRTNDDAFATVTCKQMMANAKFLPAIDANGSAVRSFFIGKAYWQTGL